MKKLVSLLTAGTMLLSMATPAMAHVDAYKTADVPKLPSDTAITLDGKMDEAVWEAAAKIEIDQFNTGIENDTRGTAYMLWDDSNLYIYYDIKDAEIVSPSEDMQQKTPWSTDSVEMFFDFTNEHTADIYQFRIDCSGWLSYYLNQSGDEYVYGPDAKPYLGDYAVSMDSDGYNIEVAVDIEKQGLQEGNAIGLQLQINDMTSADENSPTAVWNMRQSLDARSWDADLYDYVVLSSQLEEGRFNHQNKNVVYATPEIDGTLSDGEWSSDNSLTINEENGIAWSGDTISDVAMYFAWDDDGLYIAGDIEDDDLCYAPSLEEVYNKDAMQFAFDPAGMLAAGGKTGGMFYSIGLMADGALGAVYHPYGGVGESFDYTGASSVTENGWQFEMMIPWTSIEILEDDGFVWNHADNEVIRALFCVLDRDEDGAVSNCYMPTVTGSVSFFPADYPYALKLYQAPLEKPDTSNRGVVAKVDATAITVDASLDEAVWANALQIPIDTLHAGDATGTYGTAYLLWANDTWYLAVDVKDADVVPPTKDAQQNYPWNTDSVEIFFDFGNEHAALVEQFRLDCTGWPSYYVEGGSVYAYGDDAAPYFGDYSVQTTDTGYVIEMCMDMSDYNLIEGYEIGIQLQINDMSKSNPDGTTAVYTMSSALGAGSWDVHAYDYITLGGAARGNIPHADTAMTIDGTMDDAYADGMRFTVDTLVGGEDTEASADAYLLSDNGLLYLYAEITDNDIVPPDSALQSTEPWSTDSFELFIYEADGDDVHQFRVDYSGWQSYYMNHNGIRYAYGPDAAKYFEASSVKVIENGYAIEMCIDLKKFGVSSGETIGIQMQLNDRRTDGAQSFYHLNNGGAFDSWLYEQAVIGSGEDYVGQIVMLGSIPHADTAMTIDGTMDDAYADGIRFTVDTLVGGEDTEASADAYLLSDNGLLYLYAEITDNVIVPPDPALQSTEPWSTDSFELFIYEADGDDVHQFRVDNSCWQSYYMNHNGIRYAYGPDAAKYFEASSVMVIENGYAIEMCIDLKKFGVSSGETIGIQMQLNDRRADGAQSFYHLNAGGAFDSWLYEQAVIGSGEDYVGQIVMLGSSIGNVPYIKPDRIIIDGQYSSVWDNALTVDIDQFNNGDENASTSGKAYMYWTEGKWYLFVDVKDDEVVDPDADMQANAPWQTDSVEMFFDFGHAHSDLVKQFRIDCSGYPSYYVENDYFHAYGDDAMDYFDEYKVLPDEDGYNIEMVIDLSKWGLEPGDEIGIQMQLNDVAFDNPTEWRSCWNMHQSMGASSWDADLYDYITLEAKPVEVKKPVEIPVTEDEETVSVKVENAVVQGSTVTVNTVDEEALANVFNTPAAEPDDGEDTGDTETTPAAPANTVTIDVSNVKSEDAEEAEKVQQVTIPATVVDTIKTAAEQNNVEDAKLAVHLTTGSIILDKTTLDVINKAAEAEEGTTTTVSLVIDDAEDNLNETQTAALENTAEDEVVYGKLEISMEVTKTTDSETTTEKIHDFDGGTVQLEVPFEIPEGLNAAGFTVYYLDEDGNLEPMDTQYVNGKITWTTGHFSDYIILYEEPVKAPDRKAEVVEIVVDFCDRLVDIWSDVLPDRETVCDGLSEAKNVIEDVNELATECINNVTNSVQNTIKNVANGLKSLKDRMGFLSH